MKKYLFGLALLPFLGGCASIVTGTQQSVSVVTPPVAGATCKLSNSKGSWYIPNTPGSVTVHRSYDDLNVACSKTGYGYGNRMVKSHTKAMAFGNVLVGGAIGAGVDVVNGAAYDYPQEIVVPMRGRG